jgi:hypothetical protein
MAERVMFVCSLVNPSARWLTHTNMFGRSAKKKPVTSNRYGLFSLRAKR